MNEILKTARVSAMLNQRVRLHPHFKDSKIHITFKEDILETLLNMKDFDEREELINMVVLDVVKMDEAVQRGEYAIVEMIDEL